MTDVSQSERSLGFKYVEHFYGVTPHLGQRVRVDGKPGTIVPRPDYVGEHYIAVQFDGTGATHACHPTWEVEYL